MLTPGEIVELLEHPERVDDKTLDGVRETVRAFPSFHAARLLLLENLHFIGSPAYEAEAGRALLYLPCADRLKDFLEEADELRRKGMLAGDRTMILLNRYFGDSVAADDDILPENGAAQQDYLASVAELPDTSDAGNTEIKSGLSATDRMLNSIFGDGGTELAFDLTPDADDISATYIASHDGAEPDSANPVPVDRTDITDQSENAETHLDESLFTETLAGIYIKQHRYREAIEIIRSLSLTFPNKSSYFADQIRYLEKIVEVNKQKE